MLSGLMAALVVLLAGADEATHTAADSQPHATTSQPSDSLTATLENLPAAPRVQLISARVASVSDDGSTCTLAWSRHRSITIGQGVVVHAEGVPLASGRVTSLGGGDTRVRLDWVGVPPAPGFEAVILPADLARRRRELAAPGRSIWARVTRVDEVGSALEFAPGTDAGFRVADELLALRRGLPVARVATTQAAPAGGAGRYTRLIGNAQPAAGDPVRLFQSPRDSADRRLRSIVLEARGRGDQTVLFPMTPADGADVGDRWQVRADGRVVGVVELREFRGPFAEAFGLAAFQRRPIHVGDEVIRRDRDALRAGRQSLSVFRTEGDRVLIDAGEVDDIVREQRLMVCRDGRRVCELTVSAVKVDFCVALIIDPPQTTAPAEHAPRVGDEVYLAPPRRRPPIELGRIDWMANENRIAALQLAAARLPLVGEWIELGTRSDDDAVGVIVAVHRDRAAAFVLPFSGPAPRLGVAVRAWEWIAGPDE